MTYINKIVDGVVVLLTDAEIAILTANDASWTPDGAVALAAVHANYIKASIGVSASGIVGFSDFLGRWQDAEYALLLQKRAQAVTAGNVTLIRQWDIALSQGFVDMTLPATLNFKNAMVTNGILTQARADVIFT